MSIELGDLIDIAVDLEREGAEYYEKLSQLAKNKSTKEIFKKFAADEREHAQLFLELKNSDDITVTIKMENEIADLIKVISHEDILPKIFDKNVENIHPLSAIKLGIKTEKNTIKFYKQILKKIKSSESKIALEALIKEEKQHHHELTEMHKNKTFDF